MASGVAATRKRASFSCEAGQLAIAEGPGGAAALSSAIADMIYKKGLCLSLSGDPLLSCVIKCTRLAPGRFTFGVRRILQDRREEGRGGKVRANRIVAAISEQARAANTLRAPFRSALTVQ